MADIKITDEASLEAWLKTRPRRDAEIIAFRAAARVFPLWGRAMEEEWAVENGMSATHFMRPLLILMENLGSTVPVKNPLMNLSDAGVLEGAAFSAISSAYTLMNLKPFYSVDPSLPKEDTLVTSDGFSWEKIKVMQSIFGARAAVAGIELKGDGTWRRDGSFDHSVRLSTSASINWLSEFYQQIDIDCRRLTTQQVTGLNVLASVPLWDGQISDWFQLPDKRTRAIWAKDPATWAFWEKWWDGVISGDMPFAEGLLRDVALIEDDIWQAGPREVAAAIARIEAAHRPQPMNEITADQALDRALAKLPPAKETEIAAVRAAVIAHRADLLENFDALQGFIALEIKRLQELNYMSEEHRDLCIQQVKTLSVIGLTVERLCALVPKQAGVAPDAAKIESLGRVYLNLFKEWPRSNAREVVDTTWRLSFVGMGALVGSGLGLPLATVTTVLTGAVFAQPIVKVVVDNKMNAKPKGKKR